MAIISKIPAIVGNIMIHTEGVISYDLIPQKKLPRFKSGQFLHLSLDKYDPSLEWPDSRVFSIMSSPNDTNKISLIISRKGKFTSRIINELKVGDELWLKLPYGDFTFDNSDDNIILVAGGTGISPFISFLDDVKYNPTEKNIKLYYGVRNSNLIIFNSKLKEYKSKIPNFDYELYIENPNNFSDLTYKNGIIDIDAIYHETSHIHHCSYYLSGPIDMIKSFKSHLLLNGIPQNKILIDSWE